jgi:hypothetical protein
MLTALKTFRSAALIALAVILLPALAYPNTLNAVPAESGGHGALIIALSLVGLLGAVTITYNFQPAGTHVAVSSTTAPTAAQARFFNSIGVLLEMAETDTTGTITHNWEIVANERGQYQPWLSWYTLTAGTALPFLSFSVAGTNAVTVTKTSASGTSGSFVVLLQRPNTLVR